MLETKHTWVSSWATGLIIIAMTASATAQEAAPEAEPASDPAGPAAEPVPEPEMTWEGEPAPDDGLQSEQAELELEGDAFDEPKDGRWYLGAFYRHTFTPGFMLGIFLQDYEAANNPGTGFEFTYSKSNLDITGTVFWQGYRTYGAYRADGDPVTDVEIIDSNVSMAAVGVNFLWTTAFNDAVALQYGIDLAIGLVLGNMRRTEAYPSGDSSWVPCSGPGDPLAPSSPNYCQPESAGGHYNHKEPRWSGGGSLPNVWFRAAIPHLALRFDPVDPLRIRVDGGFDLFSGFFVGAALSFAVTD